MLIAQNTGLLAEPDDCAREPIHIIGHIQSHGLLFALSEPDLIVQQVSANVADLLGTAVDSVLGGAFETLLGARQFAFFRSNAIVEDAGLGKPFRVNFGHGGELEMNGVAHRQDGVLIAEFELLKDVHSLGPIDLAAHIQAPLARMQKASDIESLARIAVSEIQRLSGFDRVMVYQFDEAWNGVIVAEHAGGSPVSYLGLHFPASDVPAQARKLFLTNFLRTLADVGSAPVPIVPAVGPLTGRPLDLTRSFLRSASPVHIEYLINMGVRASMTISIVVEERLWGMIACHHNTPRAVDCATRSVCELVGGMLATQMALMIDKVKLQEWRLSRKILEKYMAGIEASNLLFEAHPFQSAQLLDLFDADGLISSLDGVISYRGKTVALESLLPVLGKLQKFAARGVASSNTLCAFDPAASSYATNVSGALYVLLGEVSGDYVLLLRQDLVQTVVWGGNPDKALHTDAAGKLRPRSSFAAWQETVRGVSRPWTEVQLENARFLREQQIRLREARRRKLEQT